MVHIDLANPGRNERVDDAADFSDGGSDDGYKSEMSDRATEEYGFSNLSLQPEAQPPVEASTDANLSLHSTNSSTSTMASKVIERLHSAEHYKHYRLTVYATSLEHSDTKGGPVPTQGAAHTNMLQHVREMTVAIAELPLSTKAIDMLMEMSRNTTGLEKLNLSVKDWKESLDPKQSSIEITIMTAVLSCLIKVQSLRSSRSRSLSPAVCHRMSKWR